MENENEGGTSNLEFIAEVAGATVEEVIARNVFTYPENIVRGGLTTILLLLHETGHSGLAEHLLRIMAEVYIDQSPDEVSAILEEFGDSFEERISEVMGDPDTFPWRD